MQWLDPVQEGYKVHRYLKGQTRGPRIRLQPIESATVALGLWKETEEKELKKIEDKAKPGFDKLIDQQDPTLTGADRHAVAECISSLYRRGEGWLEQQLERQAPEVANLVKYIEPSPGILPEDIATITGAIKEKAQRPPARPLPLPLMTRALTAMRWTVLIDDRGSLVTSDTPVWVSTQGIVAHDSEVIFPLSPCRVLVCHWGEPHFHLSVEHGTRRAIHEINRRVTRGASRYVYLKKRPDSEYMENLLSDGRTRQRLVPSVVRRWVPADIWQEFKNPDREFPMRQAADNAQLARTLSDAAALNRCRDALVDYGNYEQHQQAGRNEHIRSMSVALCGHLEKACAVLDSLGFPHPRIDKDELHIVRNDSDWYEYLSYVLAHWDDLERARQIASDMAKPPAYK